MKSDGTLWGDGVPSDHPSLSQLATVQRVRCVNIGRGRT